MLGAALVLAAASAVLAAPVPAQESTAVNSTHNATAYYYYRAFLALPDLLTVGRKADLLDFFASRPLENGRAGACGSYSQDSELVVGLPAEFFPAPFVTPSSFCGDYVVVQGVNKNITARVADASTLNETMTFSIGAWDALNATETDLTTVSWRFANETEAAAAAKTAESQPSTTVAAPSSTRSITPKKPSASASTTSSWVARESREGVLLHFSQTDGSSSISQPRPRRPLLPRRRLPTPLLPRLGLLVRLCFLRRHFPTRRCSRCLSLAASSSAEASSSSTTSTWVARTSIFHPRASTIRPAAFQTRASADAFLVPPSQLRVRQGFLLVDPFLLLV